LWTLADALTLNGAPAAFDAGDDTVTLLTFRSDVRVTDHTPLLLAELFPAAGSLTWSWSTAAEAVTVRVWLDGSVHVTDQLAGLAGTVAAADMARDVFCTVCGFAELVVQSAGRLRLKVVSTLAGPYGPLLCTMALDVTVNGVPAGTVPAPTSVTLFTFMSDVAVMFVLELPPALLLPLAGSLTCSWSAATDAVTEKLWLEGPVQVTDQVSGLAGTVTAVEAASDVSCTVCGFADDVVQSAGMLSVNVVSAFVGLDGPLLCTLAEAVTLNAVPAAFDAGDDTVTLFTLRSDVVVMFVVAVPPPLSFPVVGSLTCSWSMTTVAPAEKLWFEGTVQLTDHVWLTCTAVLVARLLSCTTWLPDGVFVQSTGPLSVSIASTFTGVTLPLLCSVAVTWTLNGVPDGALPGAETLTPLTFTSAVPLTAVDELPLPLLLPLTGSLTCSWSMAAEAVTENVWLDGVVQVTVHAIPLAVAEPSAGSDVFCTVCGLAEDVVQSGGRLRVKVVSTFTGP